MNRGILKLTKEELDQLLTVLNIQSFLGTQLYEKLNSAKNSTNTQIDILLSEDEIEKILDDIGPPIYENISINSAIQKIREMITIIRQ